MAVTAVVNDTSFDITLSGWDRVWAFRRRLSIPLEHIESASVATRSDGLAPLRWRVGGTHLPRVVSAGRFTLRDRPGSAFVSVYRDPEVLVVTTAIDRPHMVVLQHPDRHDLAWYLGERIA